MSKIVTKPITANIEGLQHWSSVIQQLSSAQPKAADDKEACQRFKWAMGQNHARVNDAIKKIGEKANAARLRILNECCKGEQRLHAYEEAAKGIQLAFCIRGRDGQPIYGENQAVQIPEAKAKKFEKAMADLNKSYADVGRAHELFTKEQAAILGEVVTVDLMCVDFPDIPSEINGLYLHYIEFLILGKPKINVLHNMMGTASRKDIKYQKKILGDINATIVRCRADELTDSEVAVQIYRTLFEASTSSVDSAKE